MIPNPLKPITITIVDDHKLVRTGLARMIDDEIDMRIIAEASTGEEAISSCENEMPDIVLMDARMPGIGGIETFENLPSVASNRNVICYKWSYPFSDAAFWR